jgi:hypothetical protein
VTNKERLKEKKGTSSFTYSDENEQERRKKEKKKPANDRKGD